MNIFQGLTKQAMKSIVQSPSPAAQLREFLCNHILQYNVLCCSHCYCEQHAEPLACIGAKFSSRALRLQLHMFHLCVIVCVVFWNSWWECSAALELCFCAGMQGAAETAAHVFRWAPPKTASARPPKRRGRRPVAKRRRNEIATGCRKRGPKNGPKKRSPNMDLCICLYNQWSPFSGPFFGTAFRRFFRFLTPGFWDLTQAFACILLSVTWCWLQTNVMWAMSMIVRARLIQPCDVTAMSRRQSVKSKPSSPPTEIVYLANTQKTAAKKGVVTSIARV